MFKYLIPKQFVIQLVLFFILFSVGSALAVGIPATSLINRQTESQIFALADQANQTTLALFENQLTRLQNLALLISERPTLNQLVRQNENQNDLNNYLEDFRQNSDLDGIFICQDGSQIGQAAEQTSVEFCSIPYSEGPVEMDGRVWLLSTMANEDMTIVVGQLITSVFKAFRAQSGMTYLLYSGNDLAYAGSEGEIDFDDVDSLLNGDSQVLLSLGEDNRSFVATEIPLSGLSEHGLRLVGLLDVEQFSRLNRQFRNTILIALVLVSVIGALVAVMISRRISRPLNQLASSAIGLREGDLSTPLETTSKIWEIDQLTNAMEDARVSLKNSLDQLRLERDWIENLLDAIVEGLVTIDEKAHVTFASKGVVSILGVPAETLIGYPIDRFFLVPPGEDPFSLQIPGNNIKNKITVLINQGEKLLSVSTSSFIPPEAGNATRALLIRDVSDEDRIHRLMGAFLANITHEFRTPLAALSASVELMVDQLPELSSSEIEELLGAINIGVINLQSLIDNLIEAASIEGGRFKVNPHPVALNTILTDALTTIKPIVDKHALNIISPKQKQTMPVFADRRRTCQILVNLLSNAVKHSPKNGNITINTSIIGEKVLVEVADEGQGVQPGQKPYLFNRYTSPPPQGDFSQIGLGLGLSVVKAIVEAQNGEVGYRNRQQGGALFWFTLPLAEKVFE